MYTEVQLWTWATTGGLWRRRREAAAGTADTQHPAHVHDRCSGIGGDGSFLFDGAHTHTQRLGEEELVQHRRTREAVVHDRSHDTHRPTSVRPGGARDDARACTLHA